MKIAIDIRKIGKKGTGSETYFFYLVKELAALKASRKHQFFLLTDRDAEEARNLLGHLPDNFKIYTVTPAAKLLWTFYSLPRFLRKNSIDVLHVEYVAPFYLKKDIKIITTVHDISFRVNPGWISKKDSLVLNFLIPPSIKRADAVIAVSEFTKKEILKYYCVTKDKVFVTHPAVDFRYFSSIGEEMSKKEMSKLLGGDFPFILHVSSLQPRKNVPLVIEAFMELKTRESCLCGKEIKLVIVGERGGHNYDEEIDEKIAAYDNMIGGGTNDVIITGYQPADILPCFYKAALAFVFPSSYEGFGIPLLEAMASKTPVVTSDIAVFREVAGKAAIYVDIEKKNAAEKIAEALKEIVKNKKLREEKIKSGLERRKLFSWKKLAEKTLEIYNL